MQELPGNVSGRDNYGLDHHRSRHAESRIVKAGVEKRYCRMHDCPPGMSSKRLVQRTPSRKMVIKAEAR